MKSRSRFAVAILTMSIAADLSLAAETLWDGTWRLNPAKSMLTGSTVNYSRNEDGSLHFSSGGPIEYDFACDGRDYPTYAGRSMSCKKFSNSVYDTTVKVDGKTATVSHRVISEDGKTMTVTTMGEQPNGTVFNDRNSFRRMAGTTGLVGKWKNVKSSSSTPEIMVLRVESGVMHTEFPGYEDKVDARMDGTESPLTGATVPPGVTVSLKVEGSRRIHIVQKLNGKPLAESIQTMSADGRTLTEQTWLAGKVAEKQTFVYDKE